jgi:hypothetical protein
VSAAVARNVPNIFFTSNFTAGVTVWTLTVPLLKSSGWNDTRRFPCNPSQITPNEQGNCDYQANGKQTVPGE